MRNRTLLYKEINDNREIINNEMLEIINHSFLPNFHKDFAELDLEVRNSDSSSGYYVQYQQQGRYFTIYLYITPKVEKASFIMGYEKGSTGNKTIKIITKPNETLGGSYEELTNELKKTNIKQIFIK
jgi:hypothetical protein